jgi:hypothetical protein
MISELTLMERNRLEAEVDALVRPLGRAGEDAAELSALALALDRGLAPQGVPPRRARLWAALLRRRAFCLRTAIALASAGRETRRF